MFCYSCVQSSRMNESCNVQLPNDSLTLEPTAVEQISIHKRQENAADEKLPILLL